VHLYREKGIERKEIWGNKNTGERKEKKKKRKEKKKKKKNNKNKYVSTHVV
jgi:hypothetical protein